MSSLFFFSTLFPVFVSVIKRFYQSLGNDDSGLSPLYKYPASHYEDQLKEQRHLDQQVVHNNDKVLGEIFRARYRSEQNSIFHDIISLMVGFSAGRQGWRSQCLT